MNGFGGVFSLVFDGCILVRTYLGFESLERCNGDPPGFKCVGNVTDLDFRKISDFC